MQCRVACIQTNSREDVEHNIRLLAPMVAEAAAGKAQLIALPENAFAMEDPARPSRYRFTMQDHPGIAASRALAAQHTVWILAGSVAVMADGGKRYNRSLLIDNRGEIMAQYDKIHLFDVDLGGGESYRESSRIAPGAHAVLAATPWGALGMSICYDVRFPQLYRALAQRGAGMLAVPSAFTAITGAAHWQVLLRARAIENGAFVIAPAQCGAHAGGRNTFGHSMIVDPWGRIVIEAGDAPEIIYADLAMDEVEKVRRQLPSLLHDRAFTAADA